jgi:threonine/homoserine/homoserine lactone efflux protein
MHGRRAGFFSGMGAAAADTIYGFIAAFGLTIVSDFLIGHQLFLRLAGGMILCILGIRTLITTPEEKREFPRTIKKYAGLFTSTFLLTLTNPMTIFSFAAVFAGFGLVGTVGSVSAAGTLVIGVFLGSGLWWLFLVGIFSLFKKRFAHHELQLINRIAGIIIAGSGVVVLASLL